MKLSGCTFVRDGDLFGYPYLASINCLLNICDEVVVVVGNCRDDTLNNIKSIQDSKLKIIETVWNENMQDRGFVYSEQKMIAQYSCIGDWVLYLECDEIIHEQDYSKIRQTLQDNLDNTAVEAFVFDYIHFYGTPDHVISSAHWYKKAPRIIRNSIRTFAPDGLFWVVMEKNRSGRFPKSKSINCNMYHYGHVRNIESHQKKLQAIPQYWKQKPQKFAGYGNVYKGFINKFHGSHPKIIKEWLQNKANWDFSINPEYKLTKKDIRHIVKTWIGNLLHLDLTRKHFTLIE
jgi:hypothetical protein